MHRQGAVRPAPAAIVDLLDVHESFPERYPHLLSSGGHAGGRYDILLAHPHPPRVLDGQATRGECLAFFEGLDAEIAANRITHDHDLPFLFGHFVYFSYELIAGFEPRLTLKRPTDIPLAWAQAFDGAVIRDHLNRTTHIGARTVFIADAIHLDLQALRSLPKQKLTVTELSEDPPGDYVKNIERIRAYIAAGDIFQANLSRGYSAKVSPGTRSASVMRGLRQHNPAPFSALAHMGSTAILSASPERLMKIRGEQITTEPIAGTIARGVDSKRDQEATYILRQHPKEQAEHIMLVDLERNDLGRLCVPGSVQVKQLMAVESYATVHHLVSSIQGTLRTPVRLATLIASLFPGGSITGCPKWRCMEILSELEPHPRGPYTGSLGYINERGDIDLNILIRTMVMRGQDLCWRVGGGIVADSEAQQEVAETRAKAAGLLRALSL